MFAVLQTKARPGVNLDHAEDWSGENPWSSSLRLGQQTCCPTRACPSVAFIHPKPERQAVMQYMQQRPQLSGTDPSCLKLSSQTAASRRAHAAIAAITAAVRTGFIQPELSSKCSTPPQLSAQHMQPSCSCPGDPSMPEAHRKYAAQAAHAAITALSGLDASIWKPNNEMHRQCAITAVSQDGSIHADCQAAHDGYPNQLRSSSNAIVSSLTCSKNSSVQDFPTHQPEAQQSQCSTRSSFRVLSPIHVDAQQYTAQQLINCPGFDHPCSGNPASFATSGTAISLQHDLN
eukprot:gene28776-31963_t